MKLFLSKWQSRLFRMSEQETVVSIMCRNIHLPSGSGSDAGEKEIRGDKMEEDKMKKKGAWGSGRYLRDGWQRIKNKGD